MLSEGKAFQIFLKDSCNLSMWTKFFFSDLLFVCICELKFFSNHKYVICSLVMCKTEEHKEVRHYPKPDTQGGLLFNI